MFGNLENMLRAVLDILFIVTLSLSLSVTESKCPFDGYFYSEETGQCYLLQRAPKNWTQAQAACQSDRGANLARITMSASYKIKDYFQLLPFEVNTWIGLIQQSGKFVWVGQYAQLSWTNWASGYPTTAGWMTQHCVEIIPKEAMKWKNVFCSQSKASLCESARLCSFSNCKRDSDCVSISPTSQLCCVDNEADYCFERKNNCNQDINPCHNGGVCVSMRDTTSYRCSCKNGYTGNACDYDIDECLSSPCSAGASECKNERNNFRCICQAGYTGVTCQTAPNYCQSNPCQNMGTCESLATTFKCTCNGGFQGITCEITTNFCETNPCKNGGNCESLATTYKCSCTNGFQGSTCETAPNYCQTNPCQNMGTCESLARTFKCTCNDGFQGRTCEITTNYCENNPCKNGGSCESLDTTYECSCTDGFQGSRCETGNNYCRPNPCENGGTCLNLGTEFMCTCRAGFEGDTCETNVDQSRAITGPATTGPGNLEFFPASGATNLQPRGGITSLQLSVCAILWVYYDQTAIISLFMM